MKILLCQIAVKTGALQENFSIIKKCYKQAHSQGADLCVVPELGLTGYLAEDLFLKPSFLQDTQKYIDDLVKITGKTCLLIPAPINENGVLYNAVIAAQNGKIIGKTYKHKLPNYGVFDEQRYFTSGDSRIILVNGYKVGVPICEDIWSPHVCNELQKQGAQLLVVVNASPFEEGKITRRIEKTEQIFKDTYLPILYCNQIAAQDGIVFDGNSFYLDGELNFIGKSFEENIQLIELKDNKFYPQITYAPPSSPYEDIYKAVVFGTRQYVRENNFSKVIIGLSGGIDSAMVACIATDALGAENVSAFMLPTKFTSEQSIIDAKKMAEILNISLKTIAIDEAVSCLLKAIGEGNKDSLMYQNLQSRIRGTILMAESNRTGALLLTTGNKSEYATGYATIYGDMNGGFNPIKDIYKTDLYELARYKNIIPQSIMEKAPSAELAPEQKDSDSLPEYEMLDHILKLHIEQDQGSAELSQQFPVDIVSKVVRLVKNSEFKRRQAAPGVKISTKNFEKDRRFPITNHYE
jgi:NAD+ synthetase